VKIEYEHPLLEPIARETYGILIYQEQVMQAAQVLRVTRWAARTCCAARWQKKPEEMDQQRANSSRGARRITTSRGQSEPDRLASKNLPATASTSPTRSLRHRRLSDGYLKGRITRSSFTAP